MTERPAAPRGYEWHDVQTGGRSLEILVGGPADGYPLVFHSGTPSGAAPFPVVVEQAAARGFRTIGYSRPGYGTSAAAPGRTVAGAAADTASILDAFGDGEFVTFGWSGGGPHALACAALLGDRCVATAVIAGVAPSNAEGLDWSAGMADENLVEFELARQGGEDFETFLNTVAGALATVSDAEAIAQALGDLVTERDRATIVNGGLGEYLLGAMRQATLTGTDGWRDDDGAFLTDWEVDLAAIERPVHLWHGTDDRMVPVDHGRWVAAHVPGAALDVAEGEGHISITKAALPDLLDELAAHSGLG